MNMANCTCNRLNCESFVSKICVLSSAIEWARHWKMFGFLFRNIWIVFGKCAHLKLKPKFLKRNSLCTFPLLIISDKMFGKVFKTKNKIETSDEIKEYLGGVLVYEIELYVYIKQRFEAILTFMRKNRNWLHEWWHRLSLHGNWAKLDVDNCEQSG